LLGFLLDHAMHEAMTDWENCYLEGQTPWTKGTASPPLRDWVQTHLPQGRALVPGCGVGHDVVMLVDQGLDAQGLDLAPTAIAMASASYPQHQSRFVLGDLFKTAPEWQGSFDFIFEHTCLCALLPELRLDYEKAVHQLLKNGGELVGIWFINPEMDPGETGPPFGISLEELSELFPAQRWEIVEDQLPSSAFPGREGREQLRVMRKR
jgi:SAM-dependent methyltransferase